MATHFIKDAEANGSENMNVNLQTRQRLSGVLTYYVLNLLQFG